MRDWKWRKLERVVEVHVPAKAKLAIVERLSKAAFAEMVPFEEIMAIAKANGALGDDLEHHLRMGVRYCVDHIKRKRPAPCNRPRLRWVPSLQAWVKPGRVLP